MYVNSAGQEFRRQANRMRNERQSIDPVHWLTRTQNRDEQRTPARPAGWIVKFGVCRDFGCTHVSKSAWHMCSYVAIESVDQPGNIVKSADLR